VLTLTLKASDEKRTRKWWPNSDSGQQRSFRVVTATSYKRSPAKPFLQLNQPSSIDLTLALGMVLFFTSNVIDPPATIYMGRDKVENEDLIKFGFPNDVWFHVDKLSSAHVYLRLPPSVSSWENIPQALLIDCGQLVKANSIEGNKKDDITIIYTPWDNLKKTGDMATGQVSFHQDKRVKRIHIAKRENPIVNRLNKTKVERAVDHEQERTERIKAESAARRTAAAEKKKADLELAREREAEKKAKSYDTMFEGVEYGGTGVKSVAEMEDDFM